MTLSQGQETRTRVYCNRTGFDSDASEPSGIVCSSSVVSPQTPPRVWVEHRKGSEWGEEVMPSERLTGCSRANKRKQNNKKNNSKHIKKKNKRTFINIT